MNTKPANALLAIVGPTASGKTAVAVEVAKCLDGEIVNADSMQVYKEWNIGAAKATIMEQQGIPHHLLDVVSVGEEFSVARYQAMAKAAIADIQQRGNVPIICGGTGLYLNAVTGNLTFSAVEADPKLREQLQTLLDEKGKQALFDRLQAVDEASAQKLHPNDTKRIIRALEVSEITGVPYSQQNPSFARSAYTEENLCIIGLQWPREVLNQRIDDRVDAMMKQGLEPEARAMFNKGIPVTHPSMMGLGYRQLFAHFAGEYSLEQSVARIKIETHQFAKRQMTWFRRDLRIQWLEMQATSLPRDIAATIAKIYRQPKGSEAHCDE